MLLEETTQYFCILVGNVFTAKHNHCRCRSRWQNLDRFQYRFQPIIFVNPVVPSPCETQPCKKIIIYYYINVISIISELNKEFPAI